MLKTYRAGKSPGGCGGWGLGSRNRRGPGVAPTPRLRGQGISLGSPAGFVGSSGWGKHPPFLSCSSHLGWPLPPASPDLPSLRCTNPVWPPLLLPPSVPLRPTYSLWGSSHLLGCQSPPPAAGRCPSCGEMLTLHLPTPPS